MKLAVSVLLLHCLHLACEVHSSQDHHQGLLTKRVSDEDTDLSPLLTYWDASSMLNDLTDADVTDIMCILRSFRGNFAKANLEAPKTDYCIHTVKPFDRWDFVDSSSLTLPSGVAFSSFADQSNRGHASYDDQSNNGGEFAVGDLKCILFKSKNNNKDSQGKTKIVAAFRHQEDDSSGPDYQYAAKKYSYEGAIILKEFPDYVKGRKTILGPLQAAVGSYIYRVEDKKTLKWNTSYKTLANKFITKVVSQVVTSQNRNTFNFIISGFSLGGGLAQITGLSGNTPSPDNVISFAGNGPITKNDRRIPNNSNMKVVNIVGNTDETSQIGCFSGSAESRVCVMRTGTLHEQLVFGNGVKTFAAQSTNKSSCKKPTMGDFYKSDETATCGRLWCFNGDEFSKLCGVCRRELDHPNPQNLPQNKRAAGSVVVNNSRLLCKKIPTN